MISQYHENKYGPKPQKDSYPKKLEQKNAKT